MGKIVKMALAGEGGQGVQSVADIITDAAYAEGKEALYIPNFGVEQRGGVSIAYVQIAENQEIGSPKFKKGDIVIALSDRAVRRTRQYAAANTLYIYDASLEGIEDDLPQEARKVLAIPAMEVAKNELHPRVFNVVIMGAVIGATGVISLEQAKKSIDIKLGYKFEQNPQLRELNFAALERGAELVKSAINQGN